MMGAIIYIFILHTSLCELDFIVIFKMLQKLTDTSAHITKMVQILLDYLISTLFQMYLYLFFRARKCFLPIEACKLLCKVGASCITKLCQNHLFPECKHCTACILSSTFSLDKYVGYLINSVLEGHAKERG